MRAAAGLQVDAGNFQQAHLAGAGRRLYRHRPHQFRVRLQFGVVDPARRNRMPLFDEAVEPGGDRLLVEAGAGHIKIEPPAALADRAAGHRARHDRAQQMQAGVHAHQPVSPLPIDLRHDLGIERRQRRAGSRDMDHLVGGVALDRVDDLDRAAVSQPQRARVAGLSAARRVEHRAVEANPAFVARDHARDTARLVSIGAE